MDILASIVDTYINYIVDLNESKRKFSLLIWLRYIYIYIYIEVVQAGMLSWFSTKQILR